MIVMVKTDEPAFRPRKFSHIQCDVEGCEATYSAAKASKPAIALGWFMDGGRHRCPEHAEVNAPARALEVREA